MLHVRNALQIKIFVSLILAALAATAAIAVSRSIRSWQTAELTLRARLAASGAREAILGSRRQEDRGQLERLLTDIVRDERVVAAGLCAAERRPLILSGGIRADAIDCGPAPDSSAERTRGARRERESVLPPSADHDEVHVTWLPIADSGETSPLRLVIVQDYVHVRARERLALTWGAVLFALVSVTVPMLALLSARLTSRGWRVALRRALRGESDRGTSPSPLLEDVRALVQRRAAAAYAAGPQEGRWTRERLRLAMTDQLDDDGLVIVANREPYIHERERDGHVTVKQPASGLVSALEPVMRACSGTWIAHGSGSADADNADARGRLLVPPGERSYTLRRVWMSDEEEQGYYYGFANEGLWPLCHLAYARPIFRASDWAHYQAVNERFADAVVEETTVEDPIVLVQDYHFALAPRMIRERLPRASIITFWHIPFPNAERFGICPWREEVLHGLLGSSIVGFHTQGHCHQFMDAVDTYVESRLDRVEQAVVLGGTRTLVRPYPISVEWPLRALATVPPADECRREVFAELGLAADALLGVGVDRLDYTKGLEERLEAVERLFERRPDLVGRFTFVQLAAPSRTRIARYQHLNDLVEDAVRRINERFGTGTYAPVILLRAHHGPERVFRYYRAAHLCYVSSLHDGMNLVSKEFVAARNDESGVLVLSQFAGAAHELTEALVVNPYDLEAASEALERALDMPPSEQAERLRAMRAMVAERNVYRWAGHMLQDAAQLRQRARRALQMTGEAALGAL